MLFTMSVLWRDAMLFERSILWRDAMLFTRSIWWRDAMFLIYGETLCYLQGQYYEEMPYSSLYTLQVVEYVL